MYEKVIPFIQAKYSFKERPQFAIIVKGASSNRVNLSADNFLGTIDSHVMLAYVNAPAYPIEWVREDRAAVQAFGSMPTAQGIYYIEILEAPTTAQGAGQFMVDPLRSVTDEPVLHFQSGIEREAQLQKPPMRGTLRLWENRDYRLQEGPDYTVDYDTGAITLKTRFYPNSVLTADYYYPIESLGPIEFYWNTSDTTTLPGVVLAFGKRARKGDKVAVRVYPDRVATAQAFGGKNELTFELEVIAQDPIQSEEMADFTMVSLIADKKPALEFEGIEILDVSLGGEAEEMQDEVAEIFFYTSSITVQFRADWEIHIPMPMTLTGVNTAKLPDLETDFDRRTNQTSNVKVAPGIVLTTLPVAFPGRNNDYESIT